MRSPVPVLSEEQRAEALRKASAVRSARRAFKDSIERGELGLGTAIVLAKQDDALAGIRAADLLQCLPGVGPKRAATLMSKAGVAASRRVRGLGEHQVEALLKAYAR